MESILSIVIFAQILESRTRQKSAMESVRLSIRILEVLIKYSYLKYLPFLTTVFLSKVAAKRDQGGNETMSKVRLLGSTVSEGQDNNA